MFFLHLIFYRKQFDFVFIAFFSESLLQRIRDHKIVRFSRFQEVIKIIVGDYIVREKSFQ